MSTGHATSTASSPDRGRDAVPAPHSSAHRADDDRATVVPFSRSRPEREVRRRPPPSLRHTLGDVLRDERHDQRRSLRDVAGGAAVSVPYLSEVERGRKDVSAEVLESIARSLEIDVADVLERTARRLRSEARVGRAVGHVQGRRVQLLAA